MLKVYYFESLRWTLTNTNWCHPSRKSKWQSLFISDGKRNTELVLFCCWLSSPPQPSLVVRLTNSAKMLRLEGWINLVTLNKIRLSLRDVLRLGYFCCILSSIKCAMWSLNVTGSISYATYRGALKNRCLSKILTLKLTWTFLLLWAFRKQWRCFVWQPFVSPLIFVLHFI